MGLYAALADVAGVVPASAGHVLTGIVVENVSGATLWLHLFDAAVAYDAGQKTAARLATTAALVDAGWVQAGAGVGATLTSPTDATAHNDFDGVTAIANDRILVKDEATADRAHNGVYVLTTPADGAGQEAVLTRATDLDAASEIVANVYVRVTAGAQASTAWYVSTAPTVVDTDPIVWTASWTPAIPVRSATAARFPVPLERMTHGGAGPFVAGIAWGWSTVRDRFVAYTGSAANVAAWLHHRAP